MKAASHDPVELRDVVSRFGAAYVASRGGAILPSQKKALSDIAACRASEMGRVANNVSRSYCTSGYITPVVTGNVRLVMAGSRVDGSSLAKANCSDAATST